MKKVLSNILLAFIFWTFIFSIWGNEAFWAGTIQDDTNKKAGSSLQWTVFQEKVWPPKPTFEQILGEIKNDKQNKLNQNINKDIPKKKDQIWPTIENAKKKDVENKAKAKEKEQKEKQQKTPETQEMWTFNLTESFLWEHSTVRSVDGLIKNIISFLTYVIPSLAVCGVMIWWVMVMVSRWDEDLLSKWKASIGYSSLWFAISILAYLIIQLVQSILNSIWS